MQTCLILSLLACSFVPLLLVDARRPQRPQWFFTGEEVFQHRGFSSFHAQTHNRWSFLAAHGSAHEISINHTELSFGGALAVLDDKSTEISDEVDKFIAHVLGLPQVGRDDREGAEDTATAGLSTKRYVTVGYSYSIYVTKDYEHPYGLEIGLSDGMSRGFSDRKVHELRLGREHRLVVERNGECALSAASGCYAVLSCCMEQRMASPLIARH